MGKNNIQLRSLTGISSQPAAKAIQEAERADLDGTRTGTKPKATAKATDKVVQSGRSSGYNPSRSTVNVTETNIQRRMRLIRLGQTPPSQMVKEKETKEVGSPHQGATAATVTKEKSEDQREVKQPGTSVEDTRQNPKPRNTNLNGETVERRRNLALGLCGSRAKKYWKMVNQGVPCEEARRKANEGYTPRPDLREKAAVNTKTAAMKIKERQDKKSQPSKMTEIRMSYAKAIASVKMAVYAKETPMQTLSKEQLTWISDALVDAIFIEKSMKVRFEGIQFKPGMLGIDCTDEATANWLMMAVPVLNGWEGPELCASTADKAPRSTVVNVVFPRMGKRSVEDILVLVDHQNEGLRTEAWKIIRQEEEGEAKRVVVAIDDPSLKTIERQGYTLNFRFGRVAVKLRKVEDADAGMMDRDMEVDEDATALEGKEEPMDAKEDSQQNNEIGKEASECKGGDELESDIEAAGQMETEAALLSDELE